MMDIMSHRIANGFPVTNSKKINGILLAAAIASGNCGGTEPVNGLSRWGMGIAAIDKLDYSGWCKGLM